MRAINHAYLIVYVSIIVEANDLVPSKKRLKKVIAKSEKVSEATKSAEVIKQNF